MVNLLAWLKSLELHRLAGTLIASIFGFGAVYIIVTQAIVRRSFDPMHLLTGTHLLEVVALAGLFYLSGSFRFLRWLQPIASGVIVLVGQVLTPESYIPYVFFTITTAFLIRYDFFMVWALPKSLAILSIVLAAGVLGRLRAGEEVALAGELVVVIVGLTLFLYLFFSKYIDPHLGGARPIEFFVLQTKGLTRVEASVLEQVLIPQRTIKEIAGATGRTESTIGNHLQAIYKKVGCGHTRAELIAFLSDKVVVWDEAAADLIRKKRTKKER